MLDKTRLGKSKECQKSAKEVSIVAKSHRIICYLQ